LSRAGWTLEALVDGPNRAVAEQRFFQDYAQDYAMALAAPVPAPARTADPAGGRRPGAAPVIGFERFGGPTR
ncbi:hypothetical protein J8J40_28080, partial [Mycobacterium tuberculosis]|nr:hypothetical protein [Mycobacterium tuberculosis]